MTEDYGNILYSSKYDTFPFENFQKIYPKPWTFKFVDGGNAEIIKAPHYVKQHIRLASVTYKGKKQIGSTRRELVCEIKALINDSLKFEARYDKKVIIFDAFDLTLRDGINRTTPSKIAGIVRRLAEIDLVRTQGDTKLAMNLKADTANNLNFAGIFENGLPGSSEASSTYSFIVLDGSLQTHYINESLQGLKAIGFSKTNNLLTNKGYPVAMALNKIAPEGIWFIKVAQCKDFDVYFTKLHEISTRVFRVDVHKGLDAQKIFEGLAFQSSDLAFPGYPYGLVEADKYARISLNELQLLKIELNHGEYGEESLNAHEMLDKM